MLKNLYLASKESNLFLIERFVKELLLTFGVVSTMAGYGAMALPVADSVLVVQDSIILANLKLHTKKPKEIKYIKTIAERYTALLMADSAMVFWREATAIDANDDTAYYYQAKLLQDLGHPNSATDAIQHALAIQPLRVEYLSLYAHLCFEAKKDSQCLNACEQMLGIDSMNGDALLLSGIVLSHAQRYDVALERLNRCIQLAPNTTDALVYRADILVIMGQYTTALTDYIMAHAETIANADVLNNMGICYYQASDYRQAIALFQRALVLNHLHPQSYFNKGLAYYQLQNFDTAQLAMKAAAGLWDSSGAAPKHERFLDAMYCLAMCYKKTGDLEVAKKHFELLQKEGYAKDLSQEIKNIEYAFFIAHNWYYFVLLFLLIIGMIVAGLKMMRR